MVSEKWLYNLVIILKDRLGIAWQVRLFTRLGDFLEYRINLLEQEGQRKFSWKAKKAIMREMRKYYRNAACSKDGRAIYVNRRLPKYAALYAIVHELLHIKYPELSEEEIIFMSSGALEELLK